MKQPRDGKEVMMLIMMEYSFRGLDSQSAIVIVSVEINGIFFVVQVSCFYQNFSSSWYKDEGDQLKLRLSRLASLIQEYIIAQTNNGCCEK